MSNYNVNEIAKLWNCDEQLTYGLATNQYIRQLREPNEFKMKIKLIPVFKRNGLKSTAGKAAYFYRQVNGPAIKLHPGLFDDNDLLAKDRIDTFLHEVAHHVAYFAAKERGHGLAWQYTMLQFGLKPERCYDPAKFSYRGYKKRNERRQINDVLDELEDLEL